MSVFPIFNEASVHNISSHEAQTPTEMQSDARPLFILINRENAHTKYTKNEKENFNIRSKTFHVLGAHDSQRGGSGDPIVGKTSRQ